MLSSGVLLGWSRRPPEGAGSRWRLGVVVDALQGDYVQRPVELTIAAAVEPVAVLFAAGGVDGVVPVSAATAASRGASTRSRRGDAECLVVRGGWLGRRTR
jgi:hypothetical protein